MQVSAPVQLPCSMASRCFLEELQQHSLKIYSNLVLNVLVAVPPIVTEHPSVHHLFFFLFEFQGVRLNKSISLLPYISSFTCTL